MLKYKSKLATHTFCTLDRKSNRLSKKSVNFRQHFAL